MSEKMSTLTRFNNTVEQLIDDLILRYKDHPYFGKELVITKEKFSLLRKTNPRKSVEGTLRFIYPFKAQLMANDEQFFVSKSYDEHVKNDSHLMKVLKIKELWEQDMDDLTKKTLFDFFKVLIILAERYVAEKMETQEL
jgi:hypothetical protein